MTDSKEIKEKDLPEATPTKEEETAGGPAVEEMTATQVKEQGIPTMPELDAIKQSQIRAMRVEEAKAMLAKGETDPKREDVIDDELVGQDAKDEMKKERGKKYIENALKACINYPYIIKTNKEVLEMLLKDLDKATDQKEMDAISDSISATLWQINSYYQQIEAHTNIAKTYKVVMEKLTTI